MGNACVPLLVMPVCLCGYSLCVHATYVCMLAVCACRLLRMVEYKEVEMPVPRTQDAATQEGWFLAMCHCSEHDLDRWILY